MKRAAAGTVPRSLALVVSAIVALLGLVACGGSSSTGGGSASTAAASGGGSSSGDTIMIKDFTFTPSDLTVAPGTKITVTNQDSAAHTVTAGDKSFDSGNVAGGQTVQITAPSKPGSYPYICTYHQYMKGTLTVK